VGSIEWHDVPALVHEYGLRIFAETGTHEGEGLKLALRFGFMRAYSIEANPRLCQKAIENVSKSFPRERFEIRNEKSPQGVDWILRQLDAPTLWWLDAHFPAMYGDDMTAEELPFFGEVQRIVTAGREHDVIIADDMQVWLDMSTPFPNEPGTFRGDPSEVYRAREILNETHITYIWREKGGFMLALPRCRT